MVMVSMAFLLLLATATPTSAPEMYATEDNGEHKGSGVRFTRPDGTFIFINPHAVAFVRGPLPGEEGKATIVFSSGAKQQVKETVDQVIHGIHIDMPEEQK
jgi:uncharacterized protein YlzI (FlbEa/FlbD family)